MTAPRITLVLGGGGARGAAHLGVIEALLDADLDIARIVGTSSGSIVGAAFAAEPDICQVQRRFLEYLLSGRFQEHQQALFGAERRRGDDEGSGGMFSWYNQVKRYLRANRTFNRVMTRPSMLPGAILHDVVSSLLPAIDIADAQIPLSVVAVDLHSGHRVVFEKGPIREAVRASSSLPGIFPPVSFKGMLLCDIGVFNSLPTVVAQAYHADFVVAVDVSSSIRPAGRFETAFDVLMRIDEIGETLFRRHVRQNADLVIEPDVCDVEWYDFSSCAELVDAGRNAGRRALRRFSKVAAPAVSPHS